MKAGQLRVVSAVFVGVVIVQSTHGHLLPKVSAGASSAAPSPSAAHAVAFAQAQVRAARPYCWGGTGPSCYDCSGLVMEAYDGSIPRTSQEQWAALPHISGSQLEPGDLVFYAGSDGTQSSPGHVVMYIGHGKVIQEYGAGYDAEVTPLDAVNAGPLTGFARP